MRSIVTVLACTFMLLGGCATARARDSWPACGRADAFPGAAWAAPEPGRGWDRARLADAEALFESLDSAALMVVHRGRPIAAWGNVDRIYTAQSMRKALI